MMMHETMTIINFQHCQWQFVKIDLSRSAFRLIKIWTLSLTLYIFLWTHISWENKWISHLIISLKRKAIATHNTTFCKYSQLYQTTSQPVKVQKNLSWRKILPLQRANQSGEIRTFSNFQLTLIPWTQFVDSICTVWASIWS